MTSLAKDFFLSDVALHKICRKHDVPTPPAGWWAKKQADKTVRVTPLPKLKAGIPDRIAIAAGELRAEPDAVAAAREKARVIASSGHPVDRERPTLVARTIAALRKAKAGPTGLVSSEGHFVRCEVAPASLGRVESALSRIVAAAAQQGLTLKARGKDVYFAGDEEIGFYIAETVRRTKHELTGKEQTELAKWERKRERDARSGNWSGSWLSRPRFPEWDYHPTGQLAFQIEYAWLAGSPRRTFRDGKVQRLEDMAGDIAVGLVVHGAAKSQARLEREAAQRREEEQRRLREQTARAKHVEERRAECLEQILGEMQRVELLTGLLDRMRLDSCGGRRVIEFRRWIEEALESGRARLTGEALEQRFASTRIFGDDDDHGFRPPYH